ncbi:MAG: YrbL family protein [Pseudomonadota bacterium]
MFSEMLKSKKIDSWFDPNTIRLEEHLLLGRGSKRLCFAFPEKPDLCVKVSRPDYHWKVGQKQSFAEVSYLDYLARRDGVAPEIFPKALGWVNTGYGPGLVMEKVAGLEGFPSMSLRQLLEVGVIGPEAATAAMHELKAYVVGHGLVVSDWNVDNVIPSGNTEALKPMIIDGFGMKEPGVKNTIFTRIRYLARYRSQRSWERQSRKVEKSILDPTVGKIR